MGGDIETGMRTEATALLGKVGTQWLLFFMSLYYPSTPICWALMLDHYGRKDWKELLSAQDVKLGSFGRGDENMQWGPKWDHYSLGPFPVVELEFLSAWDVKFGNLGKG